MAAVQHPRISLPAIFPEPCSLCFHCRRWRRKEYLLSQLIHVPLASLSYTTTVWPSENSAALRGKVCAFLSHRLEAAVVSSLQGAWLLYSWENRAGKYRPAATFRREHDKVQQYPYSLPIFPGIDNVTNPLSTYGYKYSARFHLHLISCSHIFQCLSYRLVGFDQRQLLEFITWIHSPVSVYWPTLKVTPPRQPRHLEPWLTICIPVHISQVSAPILSLTK